MVEVMYRYVDVTYVAAECEYGGVRDSVTEVYLREYPVIRHTPKGVWVDLGFNTPRFVLKSARKRFACATKEEARESFIARKKKEIHIHAARIARAKCALAKLGESVL